MDISVIGSQILKLRKAAGLTQEELGKAVGVSTQAVSRWECGGAPDAGLLPSIADALGVTIDALFGRDSDSVKTLDEATELLEKYVPKDELFDKAVDVAWKLIFRKLMRTYGLQDTPGKLENCEARYGDKESLTSSALYDDAGVVLCSWAEDMSFVSVFPEPEKGYAEYFADFDGYRELFRVLSEPNALEILLELGTELERYFVAEAVAKRLGIPGEEAERLLSELKKIDVLGSTELELESGVVNTYYFRQPLLLIPLLYSARYMIQDVIYYVNMSTREKPIFRKNEEKRVNGHEKS